MLSRMPDLADPRRLCGQGKAFEGRIALLDFQRLTPLLASNDGEAAFTLGFDKDADGRCRIRGTVSAVLHLVCQRCLMPMAFPVDTRFQLAVVSGPAEAEQLPDDYDPLLLEADQVPLKDLIEDELLLATPDAPRHDDDVCPVQLDRLNQRAKDFQRATDDRENPFAVLAGLVRDKDENEIE